MVSLSSILPYDPELGRSMFYAPADAFTTMAPTTQKLTGGSASYYKLPEGASELQDLIEFKKMTFGQGNVFKAMYRLGEKDVASVEYDCEKGIWFLIRRINEGRAAQGLPPRPMPDWLS